MFRRTTKYLARARRNSLDFPKFRGEQLESRLLLDGHGLTDVEIDERIADYRSYFDGVLNAEHERFVRESQESGGNGVRLYNLQLAVDGVLSMYEATGDLDLLQRVMDYTSNVMDSARVIDNGHYERDGFLDWEALSGGRPQANRWGNMLYDFQYGSAMSRLARIIHEDSRLSGLEEIQGYGEDLIQFIDEQIVFKWLDARGQRDWLEGFYDRGYWTDKATHIISICNNVTQVIGDASSCDGIHLTLAEQFKNLLVMESDGAYVWSQYDAFPGGHFSPAPDTNHENRTATMIWQLGADNVVFDQSHVEHFGITFAKRIWNGRTDWEEQTSVQLSPWFHNYIDGTDDQYRNYITTQGVEGMNGFVYDGWIRLGEFVPEVQEAGEALLAFIRGSRWNANAIRLRNGSLHGKLALTGHLARNLRQIQEAKTDSAPNVAPSSQTIQATIAAAATAAELRTVQDAAVPGDVDADGLVGFSDFLVLADHFGNTQNQTWETGDFTGDRRVDMTDFLILAAAFGSPVEALAR